MGGISENQPTVQSVVDSVVLLALVQCVIRGQTPAYYMY